MAKKQQPTYQELSNQLDAVLGRLQQPDIRVDEAVQLYEQGLALATQLEKLINEAENTIKKLSLQVADRA